MKGIAMPYPFIFQRPEDAQASDNFEVSGQKIRRHPFGPSDRRLASSLSDISKLNRPDRGSNPRAIAPPAGRGLSYNGSQVKDRKVHVSIPSVHSRSDLEDKGIQVNHPAMRTLIPLASVTPVTPIHRQDDRHVPQRPSSRHHLDFSVPGVKTTALHGNASNAIVAFQTPTKEVERKETESSDPEKSGHVNESTNDTFFNGHLADHQDIRDGGNDQMSPKWPGEDPVSYLRRTVSTPSDISQLYSSSLRRLAVLQNLTPLPPSLAHIPWMPHLSENHWAKSRFMQSLEYPFKIQNPVLECRKNKGDKISSNYLGKRGKIQALGEFGHNIIELNARHQPHAEHGQLETTGYSSISGSRPSKPSYTHRPSFQREHLSHPVDAVFGKVLQRRHQFFQENVLPTLDYECNPEIIVASHGYGRSPESTALGWHRDDDGLLANTSGQLCRDVEGRDNVRQDLMGHRDNTISGDNSTLQHSPKTGERKEEMESTSRLASMPNKGHALMPNKGHALMGKENTKASFLVTPSCHAKSEVGRCRPDSTRHEKCGDQLQQKQAGREVVENSRMTKNDGHPLNSNEDIKSGVKIKSNSISKADSNQNSSLDSQGNKSLLVNRAGNHMNTDNVFVTGTNDTPSAIANKFQPTTVKGAGNGINTDTDTDLQTQRVSHRDDPDNHGVSKLANNLSQHHTNANPMDSGSDQTSFQKTDAQTKLNGDVFSNGVSTETPLHFYVNQSDSSPAKTDFRYTNDKVPPSTPQSLTRDPNHRNLLSRPNTGHGNVSSSRLVDRDRSERPKSEFIINDNSGKVQCSDLKQDWVVIRDYKTTHQGGYGGKYNVWTNNGHASGRKGQAGSKHLTEYRLPSYGHVNANAKSRDHTSHEASLPRIEVKDHNNNIHANVKSEGPPSQVKAHHLGTMDSSESQLASRLAWKLTQIATRRTKRYQQAREALVPRDVRFPSRPVSREASPRVGHRVDLRPSSRDALVRHLQKKTIVPYRIQSADLRSASQSPMPIDIVRKYHAVDRGADHQAQRGVAGKTLNGSEHRDPKARVTKLQADDFIHNVNQLQAKYSGDVRTQTGYPDPGTQELLDYFWSYQGIGRQILGAKSPSQGTIFCKYKTNDEKPKNKELPPLKKSTPVPGDSNPPAVKEGHAPDAPGTVGGSDVTNVTQQPQRHEEPREKRKVHLVVKLPDTDDNEENENCLSY